MLEAAGWAALAASTLVLGAWLGAVRTASMRAVGLVMGFGAGALIASVSFELTEDAFALNGTTTLALGLALGALAFFVGDLRIDRMGGAQRKHAGGESGGESTALLLGATLDAIPESLILGLTVLVTGAPGASFLVAVAVSNFPEGFASAAGMRRSGLRTRAIVASWGMIVALSAACGALGYLVLGAADERAVAFVHAFGAGALLTMVMDTMAPEAYRDAGPLTGVVAVGGFAFAFLLGQVT